LLTVTGGEYGHVAHQIHRCQGFIQIPETHRATACAMFLPLLLMHPKIDGETGSTWRAQNPPYHRFRHIFKSYCTSLNLIEANVAYYKSIKNTACEEHCEHGDWDLGAAVAHDILATSGVPMTEDEIAERFEKRWPMAFFGSRWSQLANAIGTEDIYLCFHEIGLEGIMIEGIDFLQTLLGGNDAAFENLKNACLRNGWVKELCLGLRGVAASMKMLEVSDDEEFRDQLVSQIQKQVEKVFGVIGTTDFHLAGEIVLDKTGLREAATIVTDSTRV
jgi:hypothetical protein